MNLILATYYSNYKNRVENSIYDFVEERNEYLRKKFDQYDIQKTGNLSITQLKLLLKDILVMHQMDERKSKAHLEKIVKIFQNKCGSEITLDNFIAYFDLVDILKVQVQEVPYKKAHPTWLKHSLRKILKHPYYECGVSILISLNFLVLLGLETMEFTKQFMIAQVVVNFVFLAELLVVFFSYGISYAFF